MANGPLIDQIRSQAISQASAGRAIDPELLQTGAPDSVGGPISAVAPSGGASLGAVASGGGGTAASSLQEQLAALDAAANAPEAPQTRTQALTQVAEGVTSAARSFLMQVPQEEIRAAQLQNELAELQINTQAAELKRTAREDQVEQIKAGIMNRASDQFTDPAATPGQKRAAFREMVSVDPAVAEDVIKSVEFEDENGKERTTFRLREVDAINRPGATPLEAARLTRDAKREKIREQVVRARANGLPLEAQASARLVNLPDQEFDESLAALNVTFLEEDVGNFAVRPGIERVVQRGDEQILLTSVTDPVTGQTSVQETPFEGQIVSSIGETPEQRQRREVETSELKEQIKTLEADTRDRNKGVTDRQQDNIAKGTVAADGIAIINRSIELLDSVATGGFAAAALAAKQRFGIESADEAELSNSLGKAVLSQLRATFGAAFTAQEGQQLVDLEAGFGKSVAGNRRILVQAQRLMDRVIDRGIQSAIDAGDDIGVRQMEQARAFTLTPGAQNQSEFGVLPPAGAVEFLRANDTPANRQQFIDKFQALPEGF